jgi:hypothetical protein
MSEPSRTPENRWGRGRVTPRGAAVVLQGAAGAVAGAVASSTLAPGVAQAALKDRYNTVSARAAFLTAGGTPPPVSPSGMQP